MPGSGAAIRVPARLRALAGAAILFLAIGCTSAAAPGRAREPEPSGRAPSVPFWVNPDGAAARQAEQWQRLGRIQEATLVRRIAEQPVAEWLGGAAPEMKTRALVEAAAREGREALIVVYEIPHRDCGHYSTGGLSDDETYRSTIDAVSNAIGDHRTTIVLEPDAVAHIVTGCTPRELHEQRYRLLSGAVRRLKQQPGVKVYLDAGNSSWITNPRRMVGPLRRAGIADADGFAVNVSNFETTADSSRYGHRLSRDLGGAHFVIDTSRNGNGPFRGDGRGRGGSPGENWCNPPGRALGIPPTTDTGDPLIDAYLWIKQPGDSDGQCRGGPPAGQWWPTYALGLVRNTRG
jgi:endoglucanase